MSETRRSIFDLDEFKPYRDRWEARIKELGRRRSYYDGSIYQRVRGDLVNVVGHYAPHLYQGVKPLYLP